MARTCGDLYILASKCASRRNGVQFFIFHLASWLRNGHFSELLFDIFRPSGAIKHWKKHSVSRLSYLFAHLHLLSSDCLHLLSSPFKLSPRPSFFLALLLPGCAFHLSKLSEVSLLNFLRLHYTIHYIPPRSTPLHKTTLHYTKYNHNYTTLHHINYTTLHHINYTALSRATLHYTNCITLRNTTLLYSMLHYIRLHYSTWQNSTPTTIHISTLHYIALHSVQHTAATTATAPH